MSIDREGVGELVAFCHQVGLDHVSCSPFRVPIARLAAAQAALGKDAASQALMLVCAICPHKPLAFGGREVHTMRMTISKFASGQLVHFTPSFAQDSKSALGPYEILRQMPLEGTDEASYKIKSQTSGQERIAREHQLETAP